jgi:hypothetical protein
MPRATLLPTKWSDWRRKAAAGAVPINNSEHRRRYPLLDTKSIEARINKHVDDAKAVVGAANERGNALTPSERATVEKHIAAASELKDVLREQGNADVDGAFQKLSGGGGSSDLAGAFKAAGWEPGSSKKATIPATTAFSRGLAGGKGVTFDTGDLAAWSMPRFEGVSLGADVRRIYEVFPTVAVDAGTTTVQTFRQQSRTFPTSDAVHRAFDSVAAKPETASVMELITVPMQQLATVQTGVPNIVLLQEGVRPILNQDMALALARGLEDLCLDAIIAANPGSSGATDLTTAALTARNAIAVDGYNASVILLAPADLNVALLKKGTTEVFARPDPLQRFELVPVPSLVAGTAYLLDPASAGRMFLSGLTLASFQEANGTTNSQTLRLEGTAVFQIERSTAIRKLGSVA